VAPSLFMVSRKWFTLNSIKHSIVFIGFSARTMRRTDCSAAAQEIAAISERRGLLCAASPGRSEYQPTQNQHRKSAGARNQKPKSQRAKVG
jgi:hypothetical protein